MMARRLLYTTVYCIVGVAAACASPAIWLYGESQQCSYMWLCPLRYKYSNSNSSGVVRMRMPTVTADRTVSINFLLKASGLINQHRNAIHNQRTAWYCYRPSPLLMLLQMSIFLDKVVTRGESGMSRVYRITWPSTSHSYSCKLQAVTPYVALGRRSNRISAVGATPSLRSLNRVQGKSISTMWRSPGFHPSERFYICPQSDGTKDHNMYKDGASSSPEYYYPTPRDSVDGRGNQPAQVYGVWLAEVSVQAGVYETGSVLGAGWGGGPTHRVNEESGPLAGTAGCGCVVNRRASSLWITFTRTIYFL
ncbi:hypothetical protein J6590_015230 [Homalodisca vitripennis]|nr:hypothetical protein J6590_015230 [Homalodisca vitripennis]